MWYLFAPKFFLLYGFVASALYVHLRGRVRFPFLRQLFNHSTILAPYNALMYLFSAVSPRPLLDLRDFPELAPLELNWRTISDEAAQVFENGHVRAAVNNNDLGFNSFFKRGWTRFYLKWYDQPLPSARAWCPETVALLAAIPSVKGAMVAALAPHSRLNPHRDPYAGSLRYHLGLITPNSDACFISVDGERYSWRDGEAVLFDETYIHYAENNTDSARLILLCDVERPLRGRLITALNRWTNRHVIKASATQNMETEPVGLLNRIYSRGFYPVASHMKAAEKWLKQKNRYLYYGVKYGAIAGVLWLIFS